jgi:hypothetical protein
VLKPGQAQTAAAAAVVEEFGVLLEDAENIELLNGASLREEKNLPVASSIDCHCERSVKQKNHSSQQHWGVADCAHVVRLG